MDRRVITSGFEESVLRVLDREFPEAGCCLGGVSD
jgi:hypothetical protein